MFDIVRWLKWHAHQRYTITRFKGLYLVVDYSGPLVVIVYLHFQYLIE